MHKYLAALLCLLVTFCFACGAPEESEPVAEAQQALVPEPWDEFVEHATIGIHRVLPDGTIEYANPADYVGLGYLPAEWVGTKIQPKHVSQPTINWMLAHLLAGGVLTNFPAQLWRTNGTVAYVLIQSKVDPEHGHTRCFTQEVSQAMYWLRWAELQ